MSLLNAEFREAAQRELDVDIIQRYQKLACRANTPAIIVDQFFRWQNANCHPAYEMQLDVRSSGCERNLMFDLEMLELLEVLPASIRHQRNLGSEIIRELDPNVSRVANSNTLLPLCWHPALHSLAKKFRPWIGGVRRLIKGNDYRNEGSWPSKGKLYVQVDSWRQMIESVLLDRSLFDSGVFDRNSIERVWTVFMRGDMSAQSDIERILSLGLLKRWINGF